MSLKAAAKGDRRALQVLAEIFVDMMDSQDCPGTLPCPIATLIITAILFTPISPQSIPLLRRQYPHAIRAIIRFLMAPRTLDERRALYAITVRTERECFCARDNYGDNQRVRDIHAEIATKPQFYRALVPEEGMPPLQRLLRVFSSMLSQIIKCTFDKTSIKTLVRQAERPSRYDRPAWPRDRQDVFPFGVAESITALCDWLELHPRPDMNIVRLLLTSWDTALRQLFPGLLANIIVPRAVTRVLTARLAELDELKDAPQRARARAREALMDIIALSVGLLQKFDELEDRPIRAAIGDDLNALSDFSDLLWRAYEILSGSTRLWGSPPIKGTEGASMFYLMMATRMADLVTGTPIADISPEAREEAELENNPVYQLTAYGHFIPFVCANSGCHHTRFSLGRPLSRCTGCWHAYYCSRTCQKAAWRHASAPHRDVCMELSICMDELGDALRDFEPTSEFTARDKVCRDAQVDPDDVERIIRHLETCYAGHEFVDATALHLGSD